VKIKICKQHGGKAGEEYAERYQQFFDLVEWKAN
jgi:hypothetical protein